MQNGYLFIYLILAEGLEVGVKRWNLFRYLLLAKVLEVGVIEVHEGVLEGSDQPGTILKQFVSRFMDELDEVAEGVREPLDQPLWKIEYKHVSCHFLMNMVLAVLALVELVEVAEGVREHHDHPVSRWDFLKSICLWKIEYKHAPCHFFMNINGTCCTRLSWAFRGRWGCPRAS